MSLKLSQYLSLPLEKNSPETKFDNLITISQFNQELQANPKEPHGLITLNSIFDPQNCSDEEGHPEEFVDDLHAFMQQFGNWEITDFSEDSTAEYVSPMENDLVIQEITIANPEGRAFESKDLLLINVPNYDYHQIVAIFDNDLDKHINADAFVALNFTLVDGSFKINNQEYYFQISGQLLNEKLNLFIAKVNNDLESIDINILVTTTSKQDIKNKIEYQMKTKISSFKMTYRSECQDY